MPPELLREIFSWTLPPIKDVDKLDMGQTPWLLTQVSSRWRAIALSTPSLWSRIIIDYSQNHSPYSLSLIKGMDPRAVDTFKMLSQYSLRWEELSLGLASELVPALGALRDRLPSLCRSWIQWNHPPDQGVASIDCFQTACSLVDIGIFNEFCFVPTLLPVHQLTLTCYKPDCPLDEHMRILKQTPNLVEARISIDFEEHRWPDSLETVDLLRLRRLYISNPVALKCFKVPALDGLALVEGSDSKDILPPFQSFLNHSSCFLRRICLVSPAAHTTTKLLQCCPSITELLVVHDDAERRDKIDTLILALTGVSITPHLLLIFFGCEDENHLDYMAYLEMLKSRCTAENCALKSAALLVADGPKPESATISGLHALREEGLDLLLLEGMEATDEIDRWDYKTSWN
ncbi:hypothetical protein DFH08DRAFT_1087654 [Mycena albidolilacea]|uniref:F-box domain-containing protein n=1 Tax=Mycena albidolilacea TaxID=1033008 RepID=A0AAD6Z9J8_9AGAR|nr:hypothetical protein DFH08DRAFT_1087654 [Mycena albidolilacea]